MTLRLSDEEHEIVLQTLKARLDALHTEMTRTDSPEFSIRLKREEEIIQALIERLGSALSMIMLVATLIMVIFALRLVDWRQLFE